MFGVAVVDAIRVDTAPQVASAAEAPADAAALAAPAVMPSGSGAAEVWDPESVSVALPAPGLEAWVAETTSPKLPRVELERAVSLDPFQPDRRAPARRYVLPGQRVVFTRTEREPKPAPSFRVVGAARIGQGGLALVQVDDGDLPIAVSVGESIEGYLLASVTDEGATLTAEDGRWVLEVVEPREDRRSNNNRGNRGNRGRNNNNVDVERALEQSIQGLIQTGLQIFGGQDGRGGIRFNLGGRGGGRGGAGGADAQELLFRAIGRRGGGGR